jgi:transcriptional regulator of PTS gene
MLIRLDDSRFAAPAVRDCARVLAAVLNGAASSRPQLVEQLGLRSTTVSRLVAELVGRRLLLETAGEKLGRGRPAAILLANPRGLGVSVLRVASRTVVGVLVDMAGRVLERCARPVGPDADNAAMAAVLADVAQRLRAAVPRGMTHAGTSVSVAGLVEVRSGQWLVSSRWPRINRLDIPAALDAVAPPVLVMRQLEAELQARIAATPERHAGGSLLLHWGWGIGLAYAVNGETFNAAGGPFGEIGHWRFDALAGRPCGCGNTGCLETGAALWALLPELQAQWPDLVEDEARLAEQFPGLDLLARPAMAAATGLVARALANLCRLLFPERILVSGPLAANAAYWARFDAVFRQEGLLRGLSLPPLVHEPASETLGIHGAAEPLLTRAVERMLHGGAAPLS